MSIRCLKGEKGKIPQSFFFFLTSNEILVHNDLRPQGCCYLGARLENK
jgi:hypothetical protein